jgi:hypothetical protein
MSHADLMMIGHFAKLGMIICFGVVFIVFAYAQWGQDKK